ncbi:DUF2637 domain-containing protein [Streptomyces sp.]|uniref:DUF2637 domain-containing protein n=1 Tax=Streptomyces sp. TaxID=1931 RepID=UPI002F416A2A
MPRAAWQGLNDGAYGAAPGAENALTDTGIGVIPQQWNPEAELEQLLDSFDGLDAERVADQAGPPGAAAEWQSDTMRIPAAGRVVRGRRRRPPVRVARLVSVQVLSFASAALAAAIVAMVSVLSGVIAYDPLRLVASPGTAGDLADWWPLLVYGPWAVASLSILRAALHRRRAVHSWSVVLLFSALAVALCVTEAPKSFTGCAVVALPPVAALACFQQLVRQITLTLPPRQPHRRHCGNHPH